MNFARGFGKYFGLAYTTGILFSALFMLIILSLETGKSVLNQRFISTYTILGFVAVLGLFIIAVLDYYSKIKPNPASQALFVASSQAESKQRLLFKVRVIIPIVLSLFLIIIQFGFVSQVIPVPMPYQVNDATLSFDQVLASHGDVSNFIWISAYPGLYEETAIFILVALLAYFFKAIFYAAGFKKAFQSAFFTIISVPIASAIGAYVFAQAHGISYGTNTQLYASAFFFEWTVQMMNQFTGLFTSWLPHMVHNALVATSLTIGLSVGGSILANFFWLPQTREHTGGGEI